MQYLDVLDFVEILRSKVIILRINEGALREKKKHIQIHRSISYSAGKKEFSIMDAKQGIVKVKDDLLKEAFETLVTKKKREHEMIVF